MTVTAATEAVRRVVVIRDDDADAVIVASVYCSVLL